MSLLYLAVEHCSRREITHPAEVQSADIPQPRWWWTVDSFTVVLQTHQTCHGLGTRFCCRDWQTAISKEHFGWSRQRLWCYRCSSASFGVQSTFMRGFQASISILFILDATREEALETLGSPETSLCQKKLNPLSLTLKVEGLNKYHPAWIWGQDLADQMIGCFFYDSACCAHDLSAEANIHESDQDKLTLRRWQEWTDFSQRAAGMLWKVMMSGFGKISEVKLVTGPASPHPAARSW